MRPMLVAALLLLLSAFAPAHADRTIDDDVADRALSAGMPVGESFKLTRANTRDLAALREGSREGAVCSTECGRKSLAIVCPRGESCACECSDGQADCACESP